MYKLTALSIVAALVLIGCGDDSSSDANNDESSLTRIATVPTGAEVTGILSTEDGELFFNAQHPDGKDEYTAGVTPAFVGYVSGLNINSFKGESLAVPAEAERAYVHVTKGDYMTLGSANDTINNGTEKLGGIYNQDGELLYISNDVDHNIFVKLDANNAYLYSAWEGAGRKGASSISRLNLKKEDGKWVADLANSKMVDLKSIDGGWVLCFGHTTPWGSELLGEEYYYIDTMYWNNPGHYNDSGDFITYHKPQSMKDYLGSFPNAYNYGYQIELSDLTNSNNPTLVKHYVMGRFSHENGVVMSDNKTVYQSDDDSGAYGGTGGVLFKFVADKEKDLSAGTLYAAKVVQYGGTDVHNASFDVSWVELAKSNDATVKSWIDEYAGITDSNYVNGQTSYISDDDINNWAEGKLGKDLDGDGTVESYPDDRPAFLESRKAAAAMGATYEWNKMEGITADGENLYIAMSAIGYTMSSTWGDQPWPNDGSGRTKLGVSGGDITIDDELCGAVYEAAIDENGNINTITPALVGETVGEVCAADKIANPDNIMAIAKGKVIVAEDSGDHGVDMLWLWNK